MLKKSSLPSFNFSKILSVLSLILLVSCANKSDQPTELRIVDLNGNPKPIKRMVPEGNAQMMASQNAGSITPGNPEPTNPPVLQSYQKPSPEPMSGGDLTAPAPSTNVAETKPAVGSKPFEATVSYDMSDPKTTETKPTLEEPTNLAEAQPQAAANSNKKFKLAIAKVKTGNTKVSSGSSKSGILIQIGSFSSHENANKALEQSKQIATGTIEAVDLGGKKAYRVFLGPSSNLKKANVVLKKAKKSGYKDAFIVK
jgi:cell division protein FtsN